MKPLKQNKGKITETTVCAILGSDSARSQQDIMRLMVREWHDLEPEIEKNKDISCNEKQLAQAKSEFEARTGMIIGKGGFYTHADNSLLGAAVVGFLGSDIVEIVCRNPIDSHLTINAQNFLKKYPMYYDKIQFQLYCTGASICHFIIQTPQGIDSTAITCYQNWMEANKERLNNFLSEFLTVVNNEKESKPYLLEWEYNADNDQEWLALAEKRIVLKAKLDALNTALKSTNNKLTAFAKSKDCKVVGGGVQAFKTLRKGAIQYAKIPELRGVNMDKYRKKDAEYWSVR